MVSFLVDALSPIRIICSWKLSRFQRSMSLIELRPRCNRRYVPRMQSFKDTPEIHLIIPLSAVTNHWISSVTTGHVSLPYKSTFLTHMLKEFPLNFVQIARLVRIGNNFRNASNKEKIRVETALGQPPHWVTVSPKYKKVDSTLKLSFPMLTSLKDDMAADSISPEQLRQTKFLLSVRWSVIPEHYYEPANYLKCIRWS